MFLLCNSSDSPKGAPRPCYPGTLGCPWDGDLLFKKSRQAFSDLNKERGKGWGRGEKQKRGENERTKGWKDGSSPSFTLVSEMKLTSFHEELTKRGPTPLPTPAILTWSLAHGKQLKKLLDERR